MDRLTAMRNFVAVVETGSFSRAAKKLTVANATVTESVKNLEKHLGVRLLDRTTRHTGPTWEGRIYYDRCRQVIAEIDELELALAESSSTPRGHLRVEVPAALGHAYIVPALPRFAAQYPDLKTTMFLNPGPGGLVESGIDVALQLGELKDSRLVARRIYEARHVACAAPQLLARHGPPKHPRDLPPLNCLGFYAPHIGRILEWEFRKGRDHWKHVPDGNLLFNSSEALIDVAVKGAGIIYMLDILIQPAVAAGKLKPLFTDWDTLKRPVFLVHPHKRHVPAKVRVFADFVDTLFQDLAKKNRWLSTNF
ncbi:MAG: LysR family transcriptional regulator [Betaproteobacteria bacterium]|nr:LysR family transcriptional regulator [Betaproteobacteria bacterium]